MPGRRIRGYRYMSFLAIGFPCVSHKVPLRQRLKLLSLCIIRKGRIIHALLNDSGSPFRN
jgi:hypothetical protein